MDEGRARRVVERYVAAWNRGDWRALEDLYRPDAVVHGPADWPESGEFRGWAEIKRQFERLRDPWSSDSFEILTFAARGDRIVGRVRWDFRGKDSDIEYSEGMSFSSRLSGERIIEMRFFRDHDEALAHFQSD